MNEELVRAAIAQQRDAALNALAFAHAEIVTLKAEIEDLRQQLASRDDVREAA